MNKDTCCISGHVENVIPVQFIAQETQFTYRDWLYQQRNYGMDK